MCVISSVSRYIIAYKVSNCKKNNICKKKKDNCKKNRIQGE